MTSRLQTKSDRIKRLLHEGKLSRKQIAEVVGCRPEYVRVVVKRTRGGASVKTATATAPMPRLMRHGHRYFTQSRAPP